MTVLAKASGRPECRCGPPCRVGSSLEGQSQPHSSLAFLPRSPPPDPGAPVPLVACPVCPSGFPYEKVVQRVLYLQVLDYDRFSRNDPIGEVSIPLNKVDLTQMQTFWKDLKPCSDGSVRPQQWAPGGGLVNRG